MSNQEEGYIKTIEELREENKKLRLLVDKYKKIIDPMQRVPRRGTFNLWKPIILKITIFEEEKIWNFITK